MMPVSLEGNGCCIKIAQTWAGTCVFRAQSHDGLNFFIFWLVLHSVVSQVSADIFDLKSSVQQTLTTPPVCQKLGI